MSILINAQQRNTYDDDRRYHSMETDAGRFVVVRGYGAASRVLWPDYDTREAADAAAARMNRHGEVWS